MIDVGYVPPSKGLASAGSFFLLRYNTAPYKRLQRVLHHPCSLYRQRRKTAHRALQRLFLRFVPLYRTRYQTGTSGYNTTCDTLERITAPQHLQHIPRYQRRAGRCTAQRRPPIIIMYIRARRCYGSMPDGAAYRRPCQPGGVSSCRVWIAGKCCTRRTC